MSIGLIPVLIVEDDEGIIALWRKYMSFISDDVRVAMTIPDALDEMRRLPSPSLVILDLRLPGSTHDNTLYHIEEIKRINPKVIVIVVTGHPEQSIEQLAIAAGADGFALKIAVAGQVQLLKLVERSLAQRDPSQPAFVESINLLSRLNELTMGHENPPTASPFSKLVPASGVRDFVQDEGR